MTKQQMEYFEAQDELSSVKEVEFCGVSVIVAKSSEYVNNATRDGHIWKIAWNMFTIEGWLLRGGMFRDSVSYVNSANYPTRKSLFLEPLSARRIAMAQE